MSHKYKSLLLNMPVRHIISKVAMIMRIRTIPIMIDSEYSNDKGKTSLKKRMFSFGIAQITRGLVTRSPGVNPN